NGAVCVIGNEANGVSSEVKALCDECITIPMLGRAESLNACTAAAITMWEMLR
ncbi:MAG: TrmH family RNA methyltransferase, partial [Eubacterium sp.]